MENIWARNAYLIDDLTLGEFSGSEKNSKFSGGSRKSLGSFWIGSEGFPK